MRPQRRRITTAIIKLNVRVIVMQVTGLVTSEMTEYLINKMSIGVMKESKKRNIPRRDLLHNYFYWSICSYYGEKFKLVNAKCRIEEIGIRSSLREGITTKYHSSR